LTGLALAMVAAGCSSSKIELPEPRMVIYAPQVPLFMSGAPSWLLTNSQNFTAHVSAEGLSIPADQVLSGELFIRGSRLLFAPKPTKEETKDGPEPGFSFIWDVADKKGFLLSEALQGWAPLTQRAQTTNAVRQPQGPPQKLGGHPTQQEYVVFETSDGARAGFQVWRATDLGGFPVQITSLTSSPPVRITFTKIKTTTLPADLFAPPESFARYSSPEALVDELAARYHNLRGPRIDLIPSTPPPPLQDHP
jgi:hypothetical protein